MFKNLEYYMTLPYRVEILQIPDAEGGGFMARLPEIGKYAILGDGDTPEEALRNLNESKRERFAEYIAKGLDIPEPCPAQSEFSGQFVLRLPKYLHAELSNLAKENGVSLNQFLTSALAGYASVQSLTHKIEQVGLNIKLLSDHICDLSYKIDSNLSSLGISSDAGIPNAEDDYDRAA